MTKLSIIIPCFNEAKNIPALIKKIDPIIDENIEVILVDNGSTDKTGEIIELELLNRNSVLKSISVSKNIGYGNGIMRGVKEAKGEIIAWTHADGQTPLIDVITSYQIFCRCQENIDLIKGISTSRKDGLIAKTFTMFFNIIRIGIQLYLQNNMIVTFLFKIYERKNEEQINKSTI